MKGFFHTILILFTLLPFSLQGQDDDIIFKGNFQDLPFTDFEEDLEKRKGIQI